MLNNINVCKIPDSEVSTSSLAMAQLVQETRELFPRIITLVGSYAESGLQFSWVVASSLAH